MMIIIWCSTIWGKILNNFYCFTISFYFTMSCAENSLKEVLLLFHFLHFSSLINPHDKISFLANLNLGFPGSKPATDSISSQSVKVSLGGHQPWYQQLTLYFALNLYRHEYQKFLWELATTGIILSPRLSYSLFLSHHDADISNACHPKVLY